MIAASSAASPSTPTGTVSTIAETVGVELACDGKSRIEIPMNATSALNTGISSCCANEAGPLDVDTHAI
jgi:hypothetical protein